MTLVVKSVGCVVDCSWWVGNKVRRICLSFIVFHGYEFFSMSFNYGHGFWFWGLGFLVKE
jgi:hypothetical protein